MQGQWSHGRAYYRCKFTEDYPSCDDHPRSIYVKESAVVAGLNRFLNNTFNEDIDRTVAVLADAEEPDPDADERYSELRARIADCDRRLDRYRAALEQADGEIGSITRWITEVERERKVVQAQLGRTVPGGKLTKRQVRALVEALRDIVSLLAQADEDDRNELYQQLGVSLTYHPDGRVLVEALPRGVMVRVGGGT
jgi:hypothetical protein